MKKQIVEVFNKLGIEIRSANVKPDTVDYKEIYPVESIISRSFYNLGAGKFSHPCWTNIDGESNWYTDLNGSEQIGISYDLFDHKPLPIDSDSAEIFYPSHTIEHTDDISVMFIFKEIHRTLKKGGVFRVLTPNADLGYQAYKRDDRKYFFWIEWEHMNRDIEKQCIRMPLREASTAQVFLEDIAGDASELSTIGNVKRISDVELERLFNELPFDQVLNYCTSLCSIENQKKFPFRHMNWFNEAKLNRMLKEAGFGTVKRSSYLQSDLHVLRNSNYFDQTLPKVSIYMEALK